MYVIMNICVYALLYLCIYIYIYVYLGKLPSLKFSHLQIAILVAIGLQHKDVDNICNELNLPSNQVLAYFNKTIRKIAMYLKRLVESNVAQESQMSASVLSRVEQRVGHLQPLLVNLNNDLKMNVNTATNNNNK